MSHLSLKAWDLDYGDDHTAQSLTEYQYIIPKMGGKQSENMVELRENDKPQKSYNERLTSATICLSYEQFRLEENCLHNWKVFTLAAKVSAINHLRRQCQYETL
jgi:hypothetical protein